MTEESWHNVDSHSKTGKLNVNKLKKLGTLANIARSTVIFIHNYMGHLLLADAQA